MRQMAPSASGGGLNYINILTQRDLISRVEVDTFFPVHIGGFQIFFDCYTSLGISWNPYDLTWGIFFQRGGKYPSTK